ncbi:MAG: hypothetical protein HZC25_13755 [Rhodospirillales bacterium]|nr:hypothetical protein [Rhodospirillales bacterium]
MTSLDLPLDTQTVPIPLHRLGVDDQGRVIQRERQGPVRFQFDYKGMTFDGVLDDRPDSAQLTLSLDFGPLPFSAKSPQARFNLARVMEVAKEKVGSDLSLSKDEEILFSRTVNLEPPVSAASLVTAIATAILPAEPFLELVATLMPKKALRTPFAPPPKPPPSINYDDVDPA